MSFKFLKENNPLSQTKTTSFIGKLFFHSSMQLISVETSAVFPGNNLYPTGTPFSVVAKAKVT